MNGPRPKRLPRWPARAAIFAIAMAVAGVGLPGTIAFAQLPAGGPPPTDGTSAPPAPRTPPSRVVPLLAEFSPAEIALAAVTSAAGIFVLTAGDAVFDPPTPAMAAPSPRSLDSRITAYFHRPGGGRFLGGVPDLAGIYVVPVVPALVYGIDSWLVLAGGEPFFSGDPNPQHRLVAYAEAVGLTLFTTGAVKYLVGRPRPYTAAGLDHPELRRKVREDNLSFFSGHSSLSFAVGTFVAYDSSRVLLRGALADASPAERFWLGRALPVAVGLGVPALVAWSRVIDQQHWPSDVLVGSAVGAATAHLVYARHFDFQGDPRGARPLALVPSVMPGPIGDPSVGMTLALSGRF